MTTKTQPAAVSDPAPTTDRECDDLLAAIHELMSGRIAQPGDKAPKDEPDEP